MKFGGRFNGQRLAEIPPWRSEWNELADYNGRRAKGIVHEPAYVERMERLQREFDEEHGRPAVTDRS